MPSQTGIIASFRQEITGIFKSGVSSDLLEDYLSKLVESGAIKEIRDSYDIFRGRSEEEKAGVLVEWLEKYVLWQASPDLQSWYVCNSSGVTQTFTASIHFKSSTRSYVIDFSSKANEKL